MTSSDPIPTPLELYQCPVKTEWVDHNGHMSFGCYSMAFYEATDALSEYLGFTRKYKDETNTANFAANMHLSYRREVKENDPLTFRTLIIGCDVKRVHVWHEMWHSEQGYIAATCELFSLHIDKSIRRVAPMAEEIFTGIEKIRAAHSSVTRPKGLGFVIEINPKSAPLNRHLTSGST